MAALPHARTVPVVDDASETVDGSGPVPLPARSIGTAYRACRCGVTPRTERELDQHSGVGHGPAPRVRS